MERKEAASSYYDREVFDEQFLLAVARKKVIDLIELHKHSTSKYNSVLTFDEVTWILNNVEFEVTAKIRNS